MSSVQSGSIEEEGVQLTVEELKIIGISAA
jgi:hypothetical protein